MLPPHDLSRIHPLSCLSLSQREAFPSSGQVRRLLGKSHGSGNLPTLHPIRPVPVIRRLRLLALLDFSLSNYSLRPASAPRCAPFLDPCLASDGNDHPEPPLPTQMPASPTFHYALRTISHLVAESLPYRLVDTPTPRIGYPESAPRRSPDGFSRPHPACLSHVR